MLQAIIVAIITGAFALAGTYVSNRKNAALLEYRISQLEAKMDKHEKLIERIHQVEERVTVLEGKG